MQIDIPKLPGWAWAVAAGFGLLGVHHGINLAARAGKQAAGLAYDGADWVHDNAETVAQAAQRRWREAGEGTRAALPLVVAGAALILWKRGN